MNDEIVIRVEDVKKGFKIYYDRNKTLKDILSMPGRGQEDKREVLKGISFQVKKGEAVALIGKNGCGKSTMLKLLTKIIYPDSGTINVQGKVSSLLELGAGFHPDMSGRENIYLNASVFGLTRKEIDRKIDEIIEFSELGKFIDNPVRTYSSGMYMRLAFSVAINVKAEILLIDEILGVGDVSFQKKCFDRLKEIKDSGTTIVIVSHSMGQIEQICDRSIWICDGVIREEGKPRLIGQHYYQHMEIDRLNKLEKEHFDNKVQRSANKVSATEETETVIVKDIVHTQATEKESEENSQKLLPVFCHKNAIRKGGDQVWFENIKLCRQNGEETIVFKTGDIMLLNMKLHSNIDGCIANIYVSVYNLNHLRCYGTDYYSEKEHLFKLKQDNEITFLFNGLELLSGKYFISVGVYTKRVEILDEIKFVKEFFVRSQYDLKETGMFHMKHSWEMEDIEIADDN